MKIYVVCDLEGTAGVVDHRQQCQSDGKYYEQARRLATLELNALVEGLVKGGAREVVAWDGHGVFPGGLDVEMLHSECRLVLLAGDGGPEGLDSSFDAICFCGLHGMAGAAGGVLQHSFWGGVEYCTVNGIPYGEIAASLDAAGRCGVPAIFLAGDSSAVAEIRALVPEVEAVAVKTGLRQLTGWTGQGVTPSVAESLSPQKARMLIREGAQQSLGLIGKTKPFQFAGPYTMRTRFRSVEAADGAAARYGAVRIDPFTIEIVESPKYYPLV